MSQVPILDHLLIEVQAIILGSEVMFEIAKRFFLYGFIAMLLVVSSMISPR